MQPCFVCLTIQPEAKNIIILAVRTDDKTRALKTARQRAREESYNEHAVTAIDMMRDIPIVREDLRMWLAENNIVGAEAADTIRQIASSFSKMLDGRDGG